jgi:hypothetical protein
MLAASGAVLLAVSPAMAGLNFCFGPTILRSVPNPDLTDGNIEGDNGWLNAFTYRGGNGSPLPDIILRGNTFTSGGHNIVALGVSALNDETFEAGDAIVVLYKVPGQFKYGKIEIAPLLDTGHAGTITDGFTVTKWSTATTSAGSPDPSGLWSDQVGIPSWLKWGASVTPDGNPCTKAEHGSACRWDVEIGIDTTAGAADGVPSTFDAFYVDVVEFVTPDSGDPQSRQFSWPPGNNLVDVTDHTLTPAPSNWGAGSVGSTALCKGVFFGTSDITVSGLQADGNLKVGVKSTIHAALHNSGAAALGVIAHFAHAHFGTCANPWVFDESCYTEIGTAGPATIPVAGTSLQKDWTPLAGDVGGDSSAHTCLRVRLEATTNDTTFVNQGDFANEWVDHASSVSTVAAINVKGAPAPDGGGPIRVRMTEQRSAQYAYGDGVLGAVGLGALTAQGSIYYHPYRYTGKHVTVAGHRSEVWQPMTAYGYRIQHEVTSDVKIGFESRHSALLGQFIKTGQTTNTGGTTTTTTTPTGGTPAGGTTTMGGVSTLGTPDDVPPGGVATFAASQVTPATYRAINTALATDPEKPVATDFQPAIDGATQVSKKGPSVFEVSVPVGGETTLPTSISYNPSTGTGTQNTCFKCALGDAKAPAAGTLLGLMLVGILVHGRRRRRG